MISALQSAACTSRHPSRDRWLGPPLRESGLPGYETTDLLVPAYPGIQVRSQQLVVPSAGPPLVTHAPSLTWGNIQARRIHGIFIWVGGQIASDVCDTCLVGRIVEVTVPWGKGVSSGIPTGMPVSEHSLGSLGYPPRRDKRVPAAIIRFWRLRCFSAFHSPSIMQRKVRRRGRECRCWSVVRTVGLI